MAKNREAKSIFDTSDLTDPILHSLKAEETEAALFSEHTYPHAHADADTHEVEHTEEPAVARANTPTHTDTDTHTNTDAQAHTETDTGAPRHTDTQPHTDANADADEEEFKTKRMYLLVRPSVAAKINAAAKAKRTSVNDLIHRLMEQYIENNNL